MELGLKVRLKIHIKVKFISTGMKVNTRYRSGVQPTVVLGLGLGLGEVEQG